MTSNKLFVLATTFFRVLSDTRWPGSWGLTKGKEEAVIEDTKAARGSALLLYRLQSELEEFLDCGSDHTYLCSLMDEPTLLHIHPAPRPLSRLPRNKEHRQQLVCGL